MCSRCLALKGTVVGYTDEVGVLLPPLHPRCRCAIAYREESIDRLLTPTKPIEHLTTSTPEVKAFSELRLYWAENYNVKTAPEISKLHFEPVQAALEGIESVLKEFPQTGLQLKEIGVIEAGLMCTSNGYSKINFNPRYFSDAVRLAQEFESGYYIKNMNAFGAGAHEAGHLIERWLEEEYGIAAREVVLAAYGEVVRSSGFKPLNFFMREVSKHSFDKGFNECLADAVADYLVNGENAARLSKSIWRILKGETKMVAYSELQMVKFRDEEIKKHGVFDNWGFLIGIKEDAPEELKEAWLADKKMYDDAAKKGIIL